MKYLFFIEGGALAVENALKAAFDWKVRKNFARGITTEKGFGVIHFRDAFHGRSGYTLSLTNTADPAEDPVFPEVRVAEDHQSEVPVPGRRRKPAAGDRNGAPGS